MLVPHKQLRITIIVLIILSAVTIKTVSDMKIIQFAIKGTEDYSKAQDKEMEDFEKIENLLTDTISNIGSGNTNAPPSESIIPTDADIGKYVNYVPQGVDYTVESKYSGTAQLKNTEENYELTQIFIQDTNLKWQIWKVENDTLYLISETSPNISGYNNEGKLILSGAQGYNNGVTLLDNICKSNYGISKNSNVKARNLKLEDALEVISDDLDRITTYNYGTRPRVDNRERPYPIIWWLNEREDLDSSISNRSIAYMLVEPDNAINNATQQSPISNFWGALNLNNIQAWKNEIYFNMLMGITENDSYYLSSRYLYVTESGGLFDIGLQKIYELGIWRNGVYDFSVNGNKVLNSIDSIRPLVEVPLKNCKITPNATNSDTFDIAIK